MYSVVYMCTLKKRTLFDEKISEKDWWREKCTNWSENMDSLKISPIVYKSETK